MGDVLAEAQKKAEITRDFNVLYYDEGRSGGTWGNTNFLNVRVLKYPTDLWVYQEIITETKPEVIVETGTAYGGSALYLATLCQVLGRGHVVSVDINSNVPRPQHPLITYVTGSSTDLKTLKTVTDLVAGRSALVILDSDHSMKHVLDEMRLYAGFVPVGGYMIVEDGIVNGNPCYPEHGPGPTEAMEEFFLECDDFRVDESREKYMLTQNPCGFLKRVS